MSETERVSTGYMTPADFPHGTPAGFEQGCKNGCPAEETGQTCRQASVRYAGDYAYRKLVDGGAAVEVLREPELFAKVAKPSKAAKPRAVPEFPEEPVLEYSDDVELPEVSGPVDGGAVVEIITTAEPKAIETPTAVKPRPPMPEHGTTAWFSRGCKDELECPGDPTTGLTCRQAYRDYQRDYAKKRAEQPSDATAVVAKVEPTEVVLEASEKVTPHTTPDVAQESPLAPASESLALAVLRTQLADATEQRQLAVDALARSKEENVQLHLALDVAKDEARTSKAALIASTNGLEPVPRPALVVDPTEAGGVRVDLSGIAGDVSLSLEFKEHGLSDVFLTVSDNVATHTLEQAA